MELFDGIKTTEDLISLLDSEEFYKKVFDKIQEKCKFELLPNQILSGGAVFASIIGLLENTEIVYDDIDIFENMISEHKNELDKTINDAFLQVKYEYFLRKFKENNFHCFFINSKNELCENLKCERCNDTFYIDDEDRYMLNRTNYIIHKNSCINTTYFIKCNGCDKNLKKINENYFHLSEICDSEAINNILKSKESLSENSDEESKNYSDEHFKKFTISKCNKCKKDIFFINDRYYHFSKTCPKSNLFNFKYVCSVCDKEIFITNIYNYDVITHKIHEKCGVIKQNFHNTLDFMALCDYHLEICKKCKEKYTKYKEKILDSDYKNFLNVEIEGLVEFNWYDIFFNDNKFLHNKCFTKNALNIYTKVNGYINNIYHYDEKILTPEILFSSFDINAVCVAIYKNKIIYNNDFIDFLKTKELKFRTLQINTHLKSCLRIYKKYESLSHIIDTRTGIAKYNVNINKNYFINNFTNKKYIFLNKELYNIYLKYFSHEINLVDRTEDGTIIINIMYPNSEKTKYLIKKINYFDVLPFHYYDE